MELQEKRPYKGHILGGGTKVLMCKADTGRWLDNADVLLDGLILYFPIVPISGQGKTWPSVEGLLEDHTATGRQSHGRCRISLGDPRTVQTVPAACWLITLNSIHHSIKGRQNMYIIYTSLKSFCVTYWRVTFYIIAKQKEDLGKDSIYQSLQVHSGSCTCVAKKINHVR